MVLLFLLTDFMINKKITYLPFNIHANNNTIIYVLSSLIIIIILLDEGFNLTVQKKYIQFKEQLRTQIAKKYISAILALDMTSFYKNNYTDYIRMCYNSSQNMVYLISLFKETIVTIFLLLLNLFLFIKVNIFLFIAMLLVTTIYILFKFNKKESSVLVEIGFENENINKAYLKHLDDVFNLYRELTLFDRIPIAIDIAQNHLVKISDSSVVLKNYNELHTTRIYSALLVILFLFIIFITYLNINILEWVPLFMVSFLSIQKIAPTINALHLFMMHLNTSNYFILEGNLLFNASPKEKNISQTNPIKSIIVQNAYFNYGDNIIFENMSYSIYANTITGIFGESGRGKTTFIDILSGLKNYSSADIYINQEKVSSFKSLSNSISYLPQRVYLANDTLRNNITLYNKDISDEQIWTVLEWVNLSEYFKNCKLRLETEIEKSGTNLSVGQAQRIGIARALLYKKEIIILDEFSASLDYENKIMICKILQKIKDKITIVICTHDAELNFIFDNKIHLH
jgi:ABC-type multidrug transport system fused ATPase/permease subunit